MAITHHRLTVDELAERHQSLGLPEEYARTLAAMDGVIAGGSEDRVTKNVLKLTGSLPTSIDRFVQQNLKAWMQSEDIKLRVAETANM